MSLPERSLAAPARERPAPIWHFRTIRSRLLAGFLLLTAITGALGWHATQRIAGTGALAAEIFDRSLMSINYARAAAADFASMQALAARWALAQDLTQRADLHRQLDQRAVTLAEDLEIARTRAQSALAEQAADAVASAVATWQATMQAWHRAADAPAADTDRDARIAWRELDAAAGEVERQIDLLVNYTAGDGFLRRVQTLKTIELQRHLTIGGTLAALLLSAMITALLVRRIIRPVADASAAAAGIARGELQTVIPTGGPDEFGALLAAMTVMRDNIRTMMQREIAGRRSAEHHLADAIEGSREGVVLVDGAGHVVTANSQLAAFLPDAAAVLRPGMAFNAEGSLGAVLGPAVTPEVRLDDGRWLRVSRSPTRDGGFVAICGDITVQKRHEAALQDTNLQFDAALSNMSQGLCLFGPDRRLRVANRRFMEIFGLSPLAIATGTPFETVLQACIDAGNFQPHQIEGLRADARAESGYRSSTVRLQELGDGRVLAVARTPLSDHGWVATFEDITERRQAEAQVVYLARHDALTRLPNRVLLRERVEQALAELGRGAGFAVLAISLDGFKLVNDTLGHPVGDRLLQTVAERLEACARETDTVARLGNDEFAIVQTGLERAEDVIELARRIIQTLNGELEIDGHRILLGATLGIALGGSDGGAHDELMRNADLALNRAKAESRGGYRFFEPGMDARMQERRALEMDLRGALAREEFELHFQPLVLAETGRIIGFEALVRWHHPARGMVSPGLFIPLVEEIGLIAALGEWVIRAACQEAARWPEGVKVAVNVSPLQFRSPTLLSTVTGSLARSGLPAGRLELEITESVLLTDSAGTLATLHAIKAQGVRVAMDDFGTGYSSLSYLRSFPFDKIKIDQSFVRDLESKEDSRAIIRAIIGLGETLGMRTTAEGVETAAQAEQLRQYGCTELQGYHFSRPVPAANIPGLLAASHAATA